jgi:fumarate reductase subunit C
MIQEALIPIILGLAILVFLWGVLKYGLSKDDESRKESISIIINGIIIIFVMVSVWGIVSLFVDFFGIDPNSSNILQDKPISPRSLII